MAEQVQLLGFRLGGRASTAFGFQVGWQGKYSFWVSGWAAEQAQLLGFRLGGRASTAFGICINETNTNTSKVFETSSIMNTIYGVSCNAKEFHITLFKDTQGGGRTFDKTT